MKETCLFSPDQIRTVNKHSAFGAITDPHGFPCFYEGSPSDRRRNISIGGEIFVFDSVENAIHASDSLRIYQMASKGMLDSHALELMLKHGADINAWTGLYGTPLAAACAGLRPNIYTVRLMIEKGAADVCVRGPFGSPLELAAGKGEQNTVKMLLEHMRLRRRSCDHKNMTESLYAGFHAACKNGFVVIVRMILDEFEATMGTEMVVDHVDQRHGNALQVACLRGHLEIVKLLLDKRADINKETGLFGSPFSAACVQGHEKIVQELIHRGIDFGQETHDTSPLYWACMYGHENIAMILMARANLNVNTLGDVQGATSHELKHRGRELLNKMQTTRMRLKANGGYGCPGLGQHVLRQETRSSLSAASAGGYERIVEALLSCGADVNLRVGDGGSALYWACANDRVVTARLLLEHHAKVENHDTPASSPLYGAYVGGHLDIFKLLLKHDTIFILPAETGRSQEIENWLDTPDGHRYQVQRGWSGSKVMSSPARLGSRKSQVHHSPNPLLLDDGREAWKMTGSLLGSNPRNCEGAYIMCPICTLDQYMVDIQTKGRISVSQDNFKPSGDGGDSPGDVRKMKRQAPPSSACFDTETEVQPPPPQSGGRCRAN